MTNELKEIAKALVAPGKGILAADESSGTIEKRFKTINVPSTEENRRAYRELLFTSAGANDHVSGVILFDETLRQKAKDGSPFPQLLNKLGVVPGIKVDKGTKPLAGFPNEVVTEGLDGLRERFAEYHKLGARFSKWRAVISIAAGIPTDYCISANAHALARYAALSQEAGIVPVVEPEVLMDGTNTIEECYDVTTRVLKTVFNELYGHRVDFYGMLLKPNMVIAGKGCPKQATTQEVAGGTLCCLKNCVPAAVPGVVFLSGGQSAAQATANLNAMNAMGGGPWQLSFSYGRALQDAALKTWKGEAANVVSAQKAYVHRAKLCGAARYGKYTDAMEKAA